MRKANELEKKRKKGEEGWYVLSKVEVKVKSGGACLFPSRPTNGCSSRSMSVHRVSNLLQVEVNSEHSRSPCT